ncbi:Uncharacterised protein [Segatella oris]|uniref:Uncharacterized protein n=1 Tax=Segatella oris TaxID=28135 RepID=A0A448L2J8_9BACT|nr:Uncharacterised protein [Segatella oris]
MLCFASNSLAICIKLWCNLHQIVVQSASNLTVISVTLRGKVTEITGAIYIILCGNPHHILSS